jgi:cytochrome c-type biogenesis protein CcmH
LRCLVCQNQNIAESNAPLADDLRKQVQEMMRDGKSDAEIHRYLTDRYGDFVLYRPPLKNTTLILWIGPFVLLLIGLIVAFFVYRRSAVPAGKESVDADAVRRVLEDDET